MDPNLIFLSLEITFPFVICYLFDFTVRKLKNRNVIMIATIFYCALSYVLMTFFALLLKDETDIYERVIYTTLLYYGIFIMTFSFTYKSFSESYNPQKIPQTDLQAIAAKSKKIIIFSYMYRALICGVYVFLGLLAFIIIICPQQKYFLSLSAIALASLSVIFFTCNAFIRLFINCPNCNYNFFELDRELKLYNVLDSIIKKRIINCLSCGAFYALTPPNHNINLPAE